MNRKLKNEELGRLTPEEFIAHEKTPLIIVLDNIRSLNNIGSVFRTADAFIVEAVFLCGITAKPPHRDIQKTALGATETVKWKYFENTLDALKELKENDVQVVGVEQTEKSVSLMDYQPPKDRKLSIVLGHEVNGIDQEVIDACDVCVEIPQEGTKHSLNISVATGVVVWDLYTKIKA